MNIEKLDMIQYSEYIENIRNGILVTKNIKIFYSDIYYYTFNVDLRYKIINKIKFELIIDKKYDDDFFNVVFNSLIEQMGYYPTKYKLKIKNNWSSYVFNEEEFYNNNEKDYKSINILFDAEYNIDSCTNNVVVPEILYYYIETECIKYHIETRLKTPKTTIEYEFPLKKYFFANIDDKDEILKTLDSEKKYTLLKIEFETESKNNCFYSDRFIFHYDPNYKYGYITYDNIPKSVIKIIE